MREKERERERARARATKGKTKTKFKNSFGGRKVDEIKENNEGQEKIKKSRKKSRKAIGTIAFNGDDVSLSWRFSVRERTLEDC